VTDDIQNAPNVTAIIRNETGGLVLELSSPLASSPDPFVMARPDIVRNRNALFADEIARFRKPFLDRTPSDPTVAARQLASMSKAARIYVSMVFEDSYKALSVLSNFFNKACPRWRIGLGRPPIVHAISAFADYLPWEFLPLFDPYTDPQVATLLELEAACRRFLGFGAVVERRRLTDGPVSAILDATGSLPMRVIYEASYQGAKAELGFLRSRAPGVHIEGPYPRPGHQHGNVPTLAQQLRDPTLRVDGGRRSRPDQIVHFACHCETPRDHPPDDYTMRLAAEDGSSVTIRLDDLIDGMHLAAAWDHPDRRNRMPLVFLNACGTSVMDPASAASFLKPLADNGNRGFIGTMANVPDHLAYHFSRMFYAALFSGSDAGEALHTAKWNLLRNYANPLGILYSLCANASLRVLPVLEPISV
jgi:hypothetical protein